MAEYIDKTRLMKKIHTGMTILDAMREIIDAPAADVVEVVRCRECKYADTLFPATACMGRSPDFFCADGKRKDGGQEDD